MPKAYSHVLVEPHQKHITGQSDLETALHTLLDHVREPFLALKSNAAVFTHVFDKSSHDGADKTVRTHIFAPRIDMRETAKAYHIDIELPGLHDTSALRIDWRSGRELLVEGSLERPSIAKRKGFNCTKEARDLKKGAANGDEAPSYVVADEANGFEPNEDLYPSDDAGGAQLEHVIAEDPTTRSKVSPFIMVDGSNGFEKKSDPMFPLDIVDGAQLDEGDVHRVQVPTQRISDEEAVNSSVTVGEREIGRFMRCFVFLSRVNVESLRTRMVDGLLRIDVQKLGEQSEWGYDLCRED